MKAKQQSWEGLIAELFVGRVWGFTSEAAHWHAELLSRRGGCHNSDISDPFTRHSTGRIAVKVINHLGVEGMKVYRIQP